MTGNRATSIDLDGLDIIGSDSSSRSNGIDAEILSGGIILAEHTRPNGGGLIPNIGGSGGILPPKDIAEGVPPPSGSTGSAGVPFNQSTFSAGGLQNYQTAEAIAIAQATGLLPGYGYGQPGYGSPFQPGFGNSRIPGQSIYNNAFGQGRYSNPAGTLNDTPITLPVDPKTGNLINTLTNPHQLIKSGDPRYIIKPNPSNAANFKQDQETGYPIDPVTKRDLDPSDPRMDPDSNPNNPRYFLKDRQTGYLINPITGRAFRTSDSSTNPNNPIRPNQNPNNPNNNYRPNNRFGGGMGSLGGLAMIGMMMAMMLGRGGGGMGMMLPLMAMGMMGGMGGGGMMGGLLPMMLMGSLLGGGGLFGGGGGSSASNVVRPNVKKR